MVGRDYPAPPMPRTRVNTIALELPDGEVLLFPGDAHVGNCLSWNEQTHPKEQPAGSTAKAITAENLLRRTTFYKGGHHLTHNGMAKASAWNE